MADWVTISSLGTAGGTLVLALATFASVRSANRSVRLTERSVLAGLRPVLAPSRPEASPERIQYGDGHWVTIPGGGGVFELVDSNVYMAMGLRNVGQGLGVIQAWHVQASTTTASVRPEESDLRRQSRDLYIPAGDTGFWQAALRDPDDAFYEGLAAAARDRTAVTVHLLYCDHEGGQRTVSRFGVIPDEDGTLVASVSRYWDLDRDDLH